MVALLALLALLVAAPSRADIVPGRIIVAFEGHEHALRFARGRAHTLGLGASRQVRGLNAAVYTVPAGHEAEWAERISREPGVRHAAPEAIFHAARTPNDPFFSQQWNDVTLEGATGPQRVALGEPTQLQHFWNWRQDSGNMILAVLDTGADTTHPDLSPNLFRRPSDLPDGRDEDGNGYIDDTRGWNFIGGNNNTYDDFNHGTEISGVLGAVGDNGIGVAGVLWHTQILEVKVLDSRGDGTESSLAEGVVYAVNCGAKILNMSLSALQPSPLLRDALVYARERGAIVVAAAGNNGFDLAVTPTYPAAYSDLGNVVAVASSTHAGDLAVSSNRGLPVLLAAPGEGIWTVRHEGGYAADNGTSLAAPQVAGAAALYWTMRPWEDYRQVVAALGAGVRRTGRLIGRVASGGVLDMRRLLEEALGDSFPPARITDLRVASHEGQEVTLVWTAPGEDGEVGRAEAYELTSRERVVSQTGDFTEVPASPATLHYILPRPTFGGLTDTLVLRDVPYGTHSLFSLRAVDRVHNHSAPSNEVAVDLGAPPQIAFSVDTLRFDLRADASSNKRFRIYNRGGETLAGSLVPFDTTAIEWNLLPLALDFTLQPSDSAQVNVSVHGSELSPGVHSLAGRITSTDPGRPDTRVPILVNVRAVESPLPGEVRDSTLASDDPAVSSQSRALQPDFHARIAGASPGRAPVRFELGNSWFATGSRQARIVDVSGRTQALLSLASGAQLQWNGRAGSGAESPAGLYFLVLESAGRRTVLRFVKL